MLIWRALNGAWWAKIQFMNLRELYRMVYLLVLFIFVAGYIPGVFSASLDQRDFLKLKPSSKTLEGDECTVTFLTDPSGKSWVLKQVKEENLQEQVKLIFDFIAGKMGEEVQIPIPRAYLISEKWEHPPKAFPERLALLQEKVPGQPCIEEFRVNIQQPSRSPLMKEEMNKRFGELNEKDMGLTLGVIKSMSLHEDLIAIAAFDIFFMIKKQTVIMG